MASSDSDTAMQDPSKKRQRLSTSARSGKDVDDAKKARGRPRVDAQDETAADRRRTQIRLAQRAYRQRKETTISSLKKQVTELHNAIDEMSNVFLKFHERAVRSGLTNDRPDFGRELNSTLEQFTALARNATKGTEGSDVEDRGDDEIPQAPSPKRAKPSVLPRMQENVPLIPETRTDPQFANAMPLGYQMQVDGGSGGSSSERTSEEPANGEYLPTVPMRDASLLLQRFADPMSSNYLPWMSELAPLSGSAAAQMQQYDAVFPLAPPIADSLDQASSFDASAPLTLLDGPLFDFTIPEPEPVSLSPAALDAAPTLSAKLGLPYTFSFQETTFSRRLNRAAAERGFHLISQAETRPQRYSKVFRLSLMYASRDEVRARLKEVLNRTATEPLDTLGGPFQHLGGSGTHYPRKDADGNVLPRPKSFTERYIGPIRKVVEHESQIAGVDIATAFKQSNTDSWALLDGYEGEWFDADDVSGYLEERGVNIPAQASFVEGEVEDVQSLPSKPHDENLEPNLPIDFSDIFAPSSTTLANMAAGNKANVESDSFAVHNIFQSLAGAKKQRPANSGKDYFDLTNNDQDVEFPSPMKPDDFGASGWFDGSVAQSADQNSPGMTTGTTVSTDAASIENIAWDKPLRRKQTVTVEVSKLIDELIRRAVCIGRTPGFRRSDVDTALRASIISVF